MLHKLYSYFVGAACVLCDKSAQAAIDLCVDCHLGMPSNVYSCTVCALPLPPPAGPRRKQTATPIPTLKCGHCINTQSPITESLVPFLYRPPADFMVQRLKYSDEIKYARLIGELLCSPVERRYETFPDCLIPVPLHTSRLRQRGFNQAKVITQHLSKKLQIPLQDKAVQRVSASDQQASLGARARALNMRQAFAANSAMLNGKHVAIVDDVYTTGATCTALARTLLKAGVKRVDMWAFARTP